MDSVSLSLPMGQDDERSLVALSVWLRREEGVVADPGFSDWPDPLSLAGPRLFGLNLGFSIMGHSACLLFDALRHPGIITPIIIIAACLYPHIRMKNNSISS
jgi:hypothetical protein